MRIAVDLMGGDTSPLELFEGIRQSRSIDGLTYHIIASQEVIDRLPKDSSFRFHAASAVISMEDAPLEAVKTKTGSSLHKGISLIQSGQADALVTCGNTGALVSLAALNLKGLKGIDRPALLAVLPSVQKPIVVLDVGGTLACKPKNLVQLAFMGASYHRSVFNSSCPRVALLNIGVESKKGPLYLQKTYSLLKESAKGFTFLGNIEGKEALQGEVEVLVTDGFTGNIFLKTAEGISALAFDTCIKYLEEAGCPLPSSFGSSLRKRFHFQENPGGFVLGVRGIIVKCHGSATPRALSQSIASAAFLAKRDIISHLNPANRDVLSLG